MLSITIAPEWRRYQHHLVPCRLRPRDSASTTCVRLVQDLLLAKKELRLSRALRKLANYEALVIDDVGYVQQDREEMEGLFTDLRSAMSAARS